MIEKKAKIGERVRFWHEHLSNIGNCVIGNDTVIHAGVHIHDDVVIGKNCQIEANAFIPTGVIIGDNVFVGPGAIFTNDPALTQTGKFKGDWKPTMTVVKNKAKIGAGAMIKAGVVIGTGSLVGMGAVVTKNVPDWTVVVGNPAKAIRMVDHLPDTFAQGRDNSHLIKENETEVPDLSHLENDHFTD